MQNRKISTSTVVVLILLFFFAIYNVIGIYYTYPKAIYYELSGIKYQLGNPTLSEPISIEIDGTYKRKFWGYNDVEQFKGDIIINGITSYAGIIDNKRLNEYKFNDHNRMSSIVNKDFKGMLFASHMMKKVTIQIFNDKGFNNKSGWLISGPCDTREQATKISNELITYKKINEN